jgi:hypothetical protein
LQYSWCIGRVQDICFAMQLAYRQSSRHLLCNTAGLSAELQASALQYSWRIGRVPDIFAIQLVCRMYRQRSIYLIRRFSVRIPAGTSAILSEVFRGYRQAHQRNSEKAPRVGDDRFLPNSFLSHQSSTP